MSRSILTTAVRRAVEGCGYAFHCDADYRLNATIKSFPSAWMTPAKLIAATGRNEGIRKYSFTLHFMSAYHHAKADDKNEVWTLMEQQACKIAGDIFEDENVKSIEGPQCMPSELSLTNKGELALAATYTVEVPYTR